MLNGASLVSQLVKNLPPIRKTQVQSLGQEDSLEKGMATHSSTFGLPWVAQTVKNLPTATHSSILAWRIPWTEETEGL